MAPVDLNAKHAEYIDRLFSVEGILPFIRTNVLSDVFTQLNG